MKISSLFLFSSSITYIHIGIGQENNSPVSNGIAFESRTYRSHTHAIANYNKDSNIKLPAKWHVTKPMRRQMGVNDMGRSRSIWKDGHYDRNNEDILVADDVMDKETDTFNGNALNNCEPDYSQSKPFQR